MFGSLGPIVTSSFERAPWGWATLVILIGGYFRLRPLMIRLANAREKNLLEERAAEMASMREELKDLGRRLAITEEELRIVRHDLANTNTAFDLFIERIKLNPEGALEHAERVEKFRDEQRERIAQERQTLTAARIAAVAGGAKP